MRIFGTILPFIGFRRIPLNRDGSIYDSGELSILDEVAPFYTEIFAIEWLGFGYGLSGETSIIDARTGNPV
jgi:hypothetical protein